MPNDSTKREQRFSAFEKLLDAYMAMQGLNDAQLSALLNSKTYINKIRTRQQLPGTEKMEQLAIIFGVTVNDLMPGAKPPAPGGADKGRDWEDQPTPADTPLTISPAQFRNVFVLLVHRIAGEDLADVISKKDHSKQAAALMAELADDTETGLSLTSRLTQYLLTAAAAASQISPDDPRYDYPRWKKASADAADALLAIAADGPRKSG